MAAAIHRPAPLLTPSPTPDRAARIAWLKAELARERREQDAAFIALIAEDKFVRKFREVSSGELFARRDANLELRDAFAAMGIRSARHLGKALERLQGPHGIWCLERVGVNNRGARWFVRVLEDSHQPPSPAAAGGV